jgi:hypothetical protein
MKTRSIEFDHDREYGRDIRVAGIAAIILVTAAFLIVPQPRVQAYRLRGPVEWTLTIEDAAPVICDPPKPVDQTPRGVPLASDKPEVSTIGPNANFDELKPDVTAPSIETNVPFWKVERKPKLMRGVAPDYPEMARAAGIEGKVIVSMVVDTMGNVAAAKVIVTSGNVLLDRAAVEAAY